MSIQITLDSTIPASFYDLNDDHDVLTFDYQDEERVANEIVWQNDTTDLSKQKHIILNALKSCQRLLRTYPDDPTTVDYSTDNFVSSLYSMEYYRGVGEEEPINGFRSAHQIAAISEDNFTRNFPDPQNVIDKQIARRIHRKAVNIKQRVALKQSGLKDSTASPHYSATSFNNVQGDLIAYQQSLPDYEDMFGNQEMIACDESRSALSPAAYFVDLMHLADQYIKQAEEAETTLQFRRPDLWNIPLDKKHTYTSVPYLEIVNNILKNNLDDRLSTASETIDSLFAAATASYPFRLPFNLPLEQIRAYLAHFDIDLPRIFQLFDSDNTAIDREQLQLSLETFNLLTIPLNTTDALNTAYGIHDSTESLDNLKELDFFLRKTGLQAAELDELLFQNLRQKTDLNLDNHSVLSLDGIDDYVAIDSFHYASEDLVEAITIEAWVKTEQLNEGIIISFDRNPYWRLSIGSDKFSDQGHVYWTTTSEAEGIDDLFGQKSIIDGEWHHIAVSYESGSGKKQIFVDGQLDMEATAHMGDPLGNEEERFGFIGIGSEATSFDGEQNSIKFFNGQIADLRIWSVARKKMDIQTDMNRRLTGKEDHLLCYWKLDEGTGSSLFNWVTQSTDLLKADQGWAEDVGFNLQSCEYDPLLFQNLFINKYRQDRKFLSVQKSEEGSQEIISLDDDAKDRLHRFIRLAQKLGWSFTDLDFVLCSIDAMDIDEGAIQTLAQIKQLESRSGWSLDILCSLWSDLKTYGLGNESGSAALFDQIFNLSNASYQPNGSAYHPSWSNNPLYQDAILNWTVADKATTENRQLRQWLQGCLKVKERELTAIVKQFFPEETIALTVENLSLLYSFTQLPKLLGVSVDECLLTVRILTTDFPSRGADMIDQINQLLTFTDWLESAGLTIYDWQYLTSTEYSKSIDVGYEEEDVAPLFEDLGAASIDWRFLDEMTFAVEGISEPQSQSIWKRLLDDRYYDTDGILLSKYFEYENSLWYLFQLSEDSFMGEELSEGDSLMAYTWLQDNSYLDDLGNLKAAFEEETDLSTLFAGGANAEEKQEAVRAILLQVQQFYSYFQLAIDSFTSDLITASESEGVFNSLVENKILFDNGTLNENFEESSDLSFLFNAKDADLDAKTAEVQSLLLRTKDQMLALGTSIGELLTLYYDNQKNGSIEYLAAFFDAKTDLTESVLNYSLIAERVFEILQLLLSPQASVEDQSALIATMARVFYASDALEITAIELQSLASNPEWFGNSSADILPLFSTETLQSLTTFKQLQKNLGDQDNALLGYFENESGQEDKNQALAEMMDWEQSEIEYLLDSAYINTPSYKYPEAVNTADNVEIIDQMNSFFAMSIPIGVDVQFLEQLGQLDSLAADNEADWQTVLDLAQALLNTLHSHYSEDEWELNFKPIQEVLLEKERDALAGWLIWILSETYASLHNMDDLYNLLLIDVKMSGCMDVSYIKEAINCVQLYIHRCQMQLEAGITNKIPEDWWSWMDHYSLWAANRKVFLYPENYLDPSLRQAKTPIFKELEDELMQQQLSDESVTQALQNYFDKFSDLAHLKIADSYCCKVINPQSGTEEDTLFLFGATRTQPQTYYYRTAVLDPATSQVQSWGAWQQVNLTINADYVTPVFAFNKLFLFWVERTTKQIDVSHRVDIYDQETSEWEESWEESNADLTKATIKFSFQKKDGSWIAPQNVAADQVINVSPNWTDGLDPYVSSTTYSSEIRKAIPLDLDMEKICWKKVQVHRLPEQEGEPERLMVILGEMLRTPSVYPTIPPYTNSDEPEQNAFNSMLFESASFANEARTELGEGYGYTSLIPAFLMDSGLLVEQKPFFIADNPSPDYLSLLLQDPANKRIQEVSSANLFANHYSSDLLQPGLISYWPLNGSPNDIVGSNQGSRSGGKWMTASDFPLTESRSVLQFSDDAEFSVSECSALSGSEFTIEFWMKVDAKKDSKQFLFFSSINNNTAVYLKANSMKLYLEYGAASQLLTSGIQTNEWTHIALVFAVYTINLVQCTLYKDGIYENLWDLDPQWEKNYPTSFTIGDQFNGQMADLRIWKIRTSDFQTQTSINNAPLLAKINDQNTSLLTVKNHPGLFTLENKRETFLVTTQSDGYSYLSDAYNYEITDNGTLILKTSVANSSSGQYAFTRLSTNTIAALSQKLLTGEPDAFFQSTSQYLSELPFDRLEPDTDKVLPPLTDLLDFNGANQLYFWEVFFHAPFLMANLLKSEQKFAEAKKWYEYIFDPFTEAEPKGLIRDWPMNEGGGTVLHEIIEKNNASLYSGGHATVPKNAWLAVDDFPNSANRSVLNLAGTIDSAAWIQRMEGFPTNDFTFECWLKTEDTEHEGTIFSYQEEASSRANGLSNCQNLYFYSSGEETGVAINDGNWHKLSFTRQNDSAYIAIYVDDVRVYLSEYQFWPSSNDSILAFGQDVGEPSVAKAFKGQMAEVRIWNIYLGPYSSSGEPSQAEIDAALIGYWPMDEGSGSIAHNQQAPFEDTSSWEIATDFPAIDSRPVLHFNGIDQAVMKDFTGYPSDAYTIETWLKIAAVGSKSYIIDYEDDFQWSIDDGQIAFKFKGTNFSFNLDIATDRWQYLSVVLDKIDNGQFWRLKFYIDGNLMYNTEEEGIEIAGDETILATSRRLQFGRDFEGYLADIHFWEIARTQEEILLDYNTQHSSDRFWKFLPFKNQDLEKMEDLLSNLREISIYNTDPFDPDAIARMRIGAYEKAIAMRYIDNLLSWGDYLFAQDNWEAIVRASMLYLVAKSLLGAQPESTELLQEAPIKTFDNIMEDASLNVPDYQLALEAAVETASDSVNMQNLPYNAFESYFCIPENEDFLAYWDRVEDRLYKIRHCMNIDGVVRSLDLFQAPIDPNQLIGALTSGGSLSSLGAVLSTAIPHYRFSFMIRQAKELTEQLKELGAALLEALEKQDVQQLELLRASNESAILDMGLMIREKQIEELNEILNGLEISKEQAATRQETYEEWIDEVNAGPSGQEKTSMDLKLLAYRFKSTTYALRLPSIVGYLSPSIFGLADGGSDFGSAANVPAEMSSDVAEALNMNAELSAAMAEYEGQTDEWELQASLAEYDVSQIETQIQVTNLQIEVAEQELAIQQKSISQAQEMEDFLKDRFTNQELYQWMVGQLSSVYFQTYQLAYDLALAAEKTYQFELNSNESYIGFGTWDSLKKGLLSGEQLLLRLQQLEKAYIDNNSRQLEIEKTVYLSQLDPLALEDLKQNGSCTFELTEKLFDLDFPGHYNRKIKTLGLTVQADVSNYQSIQATLVQNDNRVVLQADFNTIAFLLGEGDNTPPDTAHLRSNWRANQQIAISKGANDNGLFELNFMDDRYLPFEGTGAVSSWTLQMPKASNRFNFDTLTDVMLHLKYTAESGGEALKEQVTATDALSEDSGFHLMSLKEEFPTAWAEFISATNNLPLDFTFSLATVAFNLDHLEIGDDNNEIYLFPIPAKHSTLDDLLANNAFYLNGELWDANSSKVAIGATAQSPANWTITVDDDEAISEEKLQDLVLLIAYKGSRTW